MCASDQTKMMDDVCARVKDTGVMRQCQARIQECVCQVVEQE